MGGCQIYSEGGREGERNTLNLKDTRLTPTRGYTSRDSLPCLLGRAVDLIRLVSNTSCCVGGVS